LIAELGYEERLINILGLDFFVANHIADESVATAQWRINMRLAILGYDIAFNPGACDSGVIRNFVFVFAGRDTQSTTNTLGGIDQKRPSYIRVSNGSLRLVCR